MKLLLVVCIATVAFLAAAPRAQAAAPPAAAPPKAQWEALPVLMP